MMMTMLMMMITMMTMMMTEFQPKLAGERLWCHHKEHQKIKCSSLNNTQQQKHFFANL